jgi:hypothetical protein
MLWSAVYCGDIPASTCDVPASMYNVSASCVVSALSFDLSTSSYVGGGSAGTGL